MNTDKQPSTLDADEELDDPYVHTVSTEEFVEAVEEASQEESDTGFVPNKDKTLNQRASPQS